MAARGTGPAAIVFDVNETLSDMAPLAERFADLGVAPDLSALWFASVLRDGFALTAAGASRPFAEVAAGALRALLAARPVNRPLDDAVAHVMDGFATLGVHPDVPRGVRVLSDAGHRLVTLSNGSASVADDLLSSCGLRDRFTRVLSVNDAGSWKPARAAYLHAAAACGVPPEDLMMVAVHPWDIDGAARAGLRTAWIDRSGGDAYPDHLLPPQHRVAGVDALVGALGGPAA